MRNILFDLDGTLSDPSKGIAHSLTYALEELGMPVPDDEAIRAYIGPPFQKALGELLKTDEEAKIKEALSLYRARYGTTGLYENKLYPGVIEMLATLVAQGFRLYIATSKPTVYAARIIEHFNIQRYFAVVYGSDLDGGKTEKGELLHHLLSQERLDSSETLMVGDRKYDIVGAQANGILSMGVTWGFGSRVELMSASPHFLVDRPGDVPDAIRSTELL